jgi:hypothetical protein
MKPYNSLVLTILLCGYLAGYGQGDSTTLIGETKSRVLTIEPGVGIHTNFGTDVLFSTLVQWNPSRRLSLGAHSSFNINNVTQRSFNHIETNYNYSVNQKFGIGTSLYSRKATHSFFLMVGVKYTSYQETLNNPRFEVVSTSVSSMSPDYGLMYSMKRGWKKYFFTCRMYLPLYPWPTKGSNILYADSNMQNIALEFGVGIKIK